MATNRVFLLGRLTRHPELQFVGEKKTPVCKFRIAVNEPYRDRKTGELKETTNFPMLELWGEDAKKAAERYSKGDLVLVEGRLRTDFWENGDGERRERVFVRVDSIRKLAARKTKEGETVEVSEEISDSDSGD